MSEEEQLFNRFISLKYKMQSLAGIVQNPVEYTIQNSHDIEYWLIDARKIHQEFLMAVKDTKEFLYKNINE